MKKDRSTIVLVFVFFVGLSVLLYPSLANYWNNRTQSHAIVDYEETLARLTEKDYTDCFENAYAYNAELLGLTRPLVQHDQLEGYEDTLKVGNSGVMGYISVEKIGVELPIYHGTSDAVLNVSVGHLEGSSLPIGGETCHTVLSAHRGLPSATLFTHLDKLEAGDVFTITVLDKVFTYEVDLISIVEPTDVECLNIVEGEDHCSLVTCTPYGINTHRLIVRGTRKENAQKKAMLYVPNDAYQIDPLIVAPAVAMPMLLILLILLMVKYDNKTK